MVRLPYVIFIVWVFLALAVSPVRAEVINYLVVQKQSEPMQIASDDGTHSGVISDLVREIFRGSDHQLTIQMMPFKKMQRRVREGAFKNWLVYGSPGWSPPQNINLSPTPVFTVRHSLLIAKNSDFQYSGLDSIFDKTLVLVVGYDYPGLDPFLAHGDIHDVRMVQYKRIFMELLSHNRFAGFVEMNFRLRYQLKRAQELGMRISAEDFTLADFSDVIAPYNVHLAMDPAMPEPIQAFIDRRIQALRKDGTIDEIMARYR